MPSSLNHMIPIHDYPELDSTNAQAKRLVENTSRVEPFVVSAVTQTAGRGRFRRVWHSTENSIAMTIVQPTIYAVQAPATLALMTGLAIHDVLQALIGDRACVKIKWPNDIVVDDAKISGTLIESDKNAYYVGIGINLTAAPAEVMYPTTALGRYCDIERLSLINMVASRWLERFKSWVDDGFAPIAAAYTSRLWRHGQSISVALDEARTTRIEGHCLGISEAGLLLITLASGETRALSTGDVGL